MFVLALVAAAGAAAVAQESHPYSPRVEYSAFAEYSNDSSHILVGQAQNRRLGAAGGAYSLRILHRRSFDWRYVVEVRPLIFIQDPTETVYINGQFLSSEPVQQACTSSTVTDPGPPPFVVTTVCGTRWTYGGGVSPLGQQVNFRVAHPLQPFLVANAGFVATTRDVPADDTSRFNFTFEIGGGLQWFRSPKHAWAVEYRLHHFSNADSAYFNPGIDSQVVKISYSFGR